MANENEATIDDCWKIDGDKSLSERCIGVTRFELLNKNPPEGHMWVQRRLTKKQVTTRPGNIWPDEWSNQKKWAEEKQNWTKRESNEAFTPFRTLSLIVVKS